MRLSIFLKSTPRHSFFIPNVRYVLGYSLFPLLKAHPMNYFIVSRTLDKYPFYKKGVSCFILGHMVYRPIQKKVIKCILNIMLTLCIIMFIQCTITCIITAMEWIRFNFSIKESTHIQCITSTLTTITCIMDNATLNENEYNLLERFNQALLLPLKSYMML